MYHDDLMGVETFPKGPHDAPYSTDKLLAVATLVHHDDIKGLTQISWYRGLPDIYNFVHVQ